MSTKQSNSTEEIRNDFQKLFEKSPEEQVEHRAQLLSYIFLSEAQKAMDRKGWTRKQLADEIGTSASYLTQLFRGDRLLNFKTVAKIEGALNIRFEVNVSEPAESSKNYPGNQELEWEQTQVNEPDS
jgi:ribosome-binding protein aMBF1 (putative translation factor)